MLYELDVLSPSAASAAQSVTDAVPDDFGLRHDPARAASGMLTDSFGRRHTYLRISLVERCNLRCVYCMPKDGVDLTPEERLLTTGEIVRLAQFFAEAGVTKIRLTGGEPLLRPDVEAVTEALGALPGLDDLAMTTNGLLLPKKLDHLQAAGLTSLNVSLDTLRPKRFEELTRRRGHVLVLRAIDEAISRGYAPLKINCVVMRGKNDDELFDFVRFTRDRPVEVRFIEFMPFDGNQWGGDRLVPFAEMSDRIRSRYDLEPLEDGRHATAKTYRVPGFRGRIGFITSMTEHFCEGCNRLRITADGNLKVCLFGSAEVSLRDAMREGASDEELRAIVSRAVGRKKARHAGMHDLAEMDNRPMITIGG